MSHDEVQERMAQIIVAHRSSYSFHDIEMARVLARDVLAGLRPGDVLVYDPKSDPLVHVGMSPPGTFVVVDLNLVKELASALDTLLKFSSIPRRWPVHYAGYLDLLTRARELSRMIERRG